MAQYKVKYTYTDYTDSIHGQRVSSYDIYEADSAQDAVDQCREDFYPIHEMKVTEVALWSRQGYYLPVFERAWM